MGTDKHQPEIIQSILTINGVRVWNSLRSSMGRKNELVLRAKPLHKLFNDRVPYNNKHATLASGTKEVLSRPREPQDLESF